MNDVSTFYLDGGFVLPMQKSEGVLSGGGGFVRGGFCPEGVCPEVVLSGGGCPRGFCPEGVLSRGGCLRGFCPEGVLSYILFSQIHTGVLSG